MSISLGDAWDLLDSTDEWLKVGHPHQLSNTVEALPPQNGESNNTQIPIGYSYPGQNGQAVGTQSYPSQYGSTAVFDTVLDCCYEWMQDIGKVGEYPPVNILAPASPPTTADDGSASAPTINPTPQFATAPSTPVSQTPQLATAPSVPVNPTPQMATVPSVPVNQTPQLETPPSVPVNTTLQMATPKFIVAEVEENGHVPIPEGHITLVQSAVGLPVSNSQPPGQFQVQGVKANIVPLYTSVQPSSPAPMTQQKIGGGVDVPALTDMEGEYGFNVTIEEKERTTKSPMWLMSKITKKLYTNINKAVPFEIHFNKRVPRDECRVRAAAVFSSAQFLRTNVIRCPNHASTTDITNHDFPYPSHVVRADHPEAKYDEGANGRLSVVVPLDILQDGSDFTPILLRFMCLGSCVGGINRRPIAIILTLENRSGHICGRKVIDVRVCACPTRDIRTDEQTVMNKGNKRRGSSLQDKTTATMRKKPKTVEPKIEQPDDDDDKIFNIPVRGRRLFEFMMMMKKNYYDCHPEYAAKYPDNTSFQNDDSDDDLKGNSLRGLRMESEPVAWDSGGVYSNRVILNNEYQVKTLTCPKNNSPLSKLTPKISITPSDHDHRSWLEDEENELINCSQEEIDYQQLVKEDDVHCSQNNSLHSEFSESITFSKPSLVLNQVVRKIDSVSKHVPVVQLPSYRSSQVSVKTRPLVISRQNLCSPNGEERDKKDFSMRNPVDTVRQLQYDSPHDLVHEHRVNEDYLSPGSPEMLAANVLAEGFKAKIQ